jgi:hypothetical protein
LFLKGGATSLIGVLGKDTSGYLKSSADSAPSKNFDNSIVCIVTNIHFFIRVTSNMVIKRNLSLNQACLKSFYPQCWLSTVDVWQGIFRKPL